MTTDYLQLMQVALDQHNEEEAIAVAQKAFEDEPEDEQLLAAMCAILFEKKMHSLGLLLLFTERFPNSLHPIRIYVAQIMCDNFLFDNTTSEARYFLRLVYDYNLLSQNKDLRLKEYMSKGFILLTSVYSALGARSYTKKILEIAMQFVTPIWQGHYLEEIKHNVEELKDASNKVLDEQWEAFWKSGAHYEELLKICQDHKCEEMAIRLHLIHEAFTKDPLHVLNENELLQVILVNKDNDYILS